MADQAEPEPRRRRRLRAGEPAETASPATIAARTASAHKPPAPRPTGQGDEAGNKAGVRRTGEPDNTDIGVTADTTGIHDPDAIVAPQRTTSDEAAEREVERGLRALVGAGTSQITVAAAMRARDAARPSDDDIAASEARLVIVRRGWVPREQLPRPGGDPPR